jgi:hypothetical protein
MKSPAIRPRSVPLPRAVARRPALLVGWRPLLHGSVAVVVLIAAGCGNQRPSAAAPETSPGVSGKTIAVVIDYGDGAQKRVTVAWREGMTVLDAMQLAAKHPRGIQFTHRFAGDRAFLDSLDGMTNQGGGETAHNWVYRVNDQFAHDSIGVHCLSPADVVLWKFGKYE